METLFDLEQVLINEEEFEEVIFNRLSKYSYPVLQFGKHCIYYNSACSKIFNPTHIKFKLSPEYLVILPAKANEQNAFVLHHINGSGKAERSTYPANIRNRKAIKYGWYKCYRYKDGLAIKRYEPLEVSANG